MNWGDLIQLVGTVGLAGIISTIISRPKMKGEAKQADAAGQLSLTEAQVKAQENALKSAESAANRAELSCKKCEDRLEMMEQNFKRFIGFVDDELVAELPSPEKRARARAAIREAWQDL